MIRDKIAQNSVNMYDERKPARWLKTIRAYLNARRYKMRSLLYRPESSRQKTTISHCLARKHSASGQRVLISLHLRHGRFPGSVLNRLCIILCRPIVWLLRRPTVLMAPRAVRAMHAPSLEAEKLGHHGDNQQHESDTEDHTEEAAKATRWLCAAGLDGGAALMAVLQRTDGVDLAEMSPTRLGGDWQAESGRICPVLAGAALSDSVRFWAADGKSF